MKKHLCLLALCSQSVYLPKNTHTHTHRDAGSGGGVTHSQDGDVLGPVQPPDGCLGLADPLHHGHIMVPVESIIITMVTASSFIIGTMEKDIFD